jgi:hypothetical protein
MEGNLMGGDAVSRGRYAVVAVEIVAWVKTWKTWRKEYNEEAAFEAVLERLEETSMPLSNLDYTRGGVTSKKLVGQTRYALGVVAIEAARSVDLEVVMAEALAEAEWKAQREAEQQAKELDAELFLYLRLIDKPILYRELEREAKAIGISTYYLRRARGNLGVITIEGPTPSHPRHWALPEWSRA